MTQAQNAIAAPTSRRNFLRSASAVITAAAVPALPAPSAEAAVPSIENEIVGLIGKFEGYGYSITATMRKGKCEGIYTQFPSPQPDIPYDEFTSMQAGYRELSRKHETELVNYLTSTGRLS